MVRQIKEHKWRWIIFPAEHCVRLNIELTSDLRREMAYNWIEKHKASADRIQNYSEPAHLQASHDPGEP